MNDAEKLAAVTELLATFNRNRDNRDGDRHLAAAEYAVQAIESIVLDDDDSRPVRDGWLPSRNRGAR